MAEATHHDAGKTRYDLLPLYPLDQWAQVMTWGAGKYSDRNWEQGMAWSRVYGSALRHLLAWWAGEEKDPESGLNHLGHALWNIAAMLEYTRTHPELDDRPASQYEVLD
mgnify:CR=1 FL=1